MVGTLVMAPKSVTFRRHDHLVSVLFGDLLSHSYNITFSMFLYLVILPFEGSNNYFKCSVCGKIEIKLNLCFHQSIYSTEHVVVRILITMQLYFGSHSANQVPLQMMLSGE